MLTETQWIWLQCQCLLDDGGLLCPECGDLGSGLYCTACGTRLQTEERHCSSCGMESSGRYCARCGEPMGSAVAEAIAEDRFDWDAWAKSLQPFLGGLSPQEQLLLERG